MSQASRSGSTRDGTRKGDPAEALLDTFKKPEKIPECRRRILIRERLERRRSISTGQPIEYDGAQHKAVPTLVGKRANLDGTQVYIEPLPAEPRKGGLTTFQCEGSRLSKGTQTTPLSGGDVSFYSCASADGGDLGSTDVSLVTATEGTVPLRAGHHFIASQRASSQASSTLSPIKGFGKASRWVAVTGDICGDIPTEEGPSTSMPILVDHVGAATRDNSRAEPRLDEVLPEHPQSSAARRRPTVIPTEGCGPPPTLRSNSTGSVFLNRHGHLEDAGEQVGCHAQPAPASSIQEVLGQTPLGRRRGHVHGWASIGTLPAVGGDRRMFSDQFPSEMEITTDSSSLQVQIESVRIMEDGGEAKSPSPLQHQPEDGRVASPSPVNPNKAAR